MTSIRSVTRRGLTWLLAAAAFGAVVLTSGCSICPGLRGDADAPGDGGARPRAEARKAKPRAGEPWPDMREAAGGADVGNVFGEVGGRGEKRGGGRPIGEGGVQQHTPRDQGGGARGAGGPAR